MFGKEGKWEEGKKMREKWRKCINRGCLGRGEGKWERGMWGGNLCGAHQKIFPSLLRRK
jgi:hypothetical protein